MSAVVTGPPASADDQYMAIAWSPSTEHASATRNKPTLAEAEAAAMGLCSQGPPTADCRIVVSGPGPCLALATRPENPSSYSGGFGDTVEQAEQSALKHLSGGVIWMALCQGDAPAVSGHPMTTEGGS
ncbi:MAG: DUF4189 domain-containing protein [Mycobacterium sp.]